MNFKHGDIFLVNCSPSVGHEFQNIRPAIIIESDTRLQKTALITVIPLTSNLSNRTSDDILIGKNVHNNLYRDSLVKVANVHSYDRLRFIKKIGIVDLEILTKIKYYIRNHFNL